MSIPMVLAVVSIAISLLSLAFAVYSWLQVNRPVVVARVTTASGGSAGIALNLLVENTGNRQRKTLSLSHERLTYVVHRHKRLYQTTRSVVSSAAFAFQSSQTGAEVPMRFGILAKPIHGGLELKSR